jgi:hypothetical protein
MANVRPPRKPPPDAIRTSLSACLPQGHPSLPGTETASDNRGDCHPLQQSRSRTQMVRGLKSDSRRLTTKARFDAADAKAAATAPKLKRISIDVSTRWHPGCVPDAIAHDILLVVALGLPRLSLIAAVDAAGAALHLSPQFCPFGIASEPPHLRRLRPQRRVTSAFSWPGMASGELPAGRFWRPAMVQDTAPGTGRLTVLDRDDPSDRQH